MTASAPETGEQSAISVTKWFDNKKIEAFLLDIFGTWERGRKAVDSSGKIPGDDWAYIVRRTMEYSASVAAATLEEAGGPIAASGAQYYAQAAFADGLARAKSWPLSNRPANSPCRRQYLPNWIANPF